MDKKLYRSRRDKMLGGVAGGLGSYFEIDPVLIRIIFIAATFISGVGLVSYILLWIIVPFEPVVRVSTEPPVTAQEDYELLDSDTKRKRGAVIGVVLIALGAIFLADNFLPFFDFEEFWPLLLIAIGVGLLWNANKKR